MIQAIALSLLMFVVGFMWGVTTGIQMVANSGVTP